MSEDLQDSIFIYLSRCLEEEGDTFNRDLSALVIALLEKEDTQFSDIAVDMEPFLKENTNLFIEWLKTFLSSRGLDYGKRANGENQEQYQDILEDIKYEEHKVIEKIKEPKSAKSAKSKIVFEDLNSSQEQKTSRMKRFGLPLADENEPKKSRKLDESTSKTKFPIKKKEIKEISIDRVSPTIVANKDNYVFKVAPESVKRDHVLTKNNDNQITVSIANNAAVTKIPQRCHFYPNCTKPDCPFLHPEIPCTTFPHCPYGVNCRYVHPLCKFADRCSKIGCPFTHSPFAQIDCKNGFACPGKGVTCKYKHPLLACKFGLTCSTKGTCSFSHATICTYGANCKTPACRFAHIVKLEDKPQKASLGAQQQNQNEVDTDVNVTQLSNSLSRTPPRDDTETINAS